MYDYMFNAEMEAVERDWNRFKIEGKNFKEFRLKVVERYQFMDDGKWYIISADAVPLYACHKYNSLCVCEYSKFVHLALADAVCLEINSHFQQKMRRIEPYSSYNFTAKELTRNRATFGCLLASEHLAVVKREAKWEAKWEERSFYIVAAVRTMFKEEDLIETILRQIREDWLAEEH